MAELNAPAAILKDSDPNRLQLEFRLACAIDSLADILEDLRCGRTGHVFQANQGGMRPIWFSLFDDVPGHVELRLVGLGGFHRDRNAIIVLIGKRKVNAVEIGIDIVCVDRLMMAVDGLFCGFHCLGATCHVQQCQQLAVTLGFKLVDGPTVGLISDAGGQF